MESDQVVLQKGLINEPESSATQQQVSELKENAKKPEESLQPGSEQTQKKAPRICSLDLVRGITIWLMIFVDYAGGSYPMINHEPWNGTHLADFVMPWFLFMVGNSIAISFNPRKPKNELLKHVIIRSIKIFVIGLMLQGGGFFWSYAYGYNLNTIRIPGILQRIGFAYLIQGIAEVYFPKLQPNENWKWQSLNIYKVYIWDYVLQAAVILIYVVISAALFVPTYKAMTCDGSEEMTIICDVRGSLSPECNAAGLIDRWMLGGDHMYCPGEKDRLPECSSCSPGKCDMEGRADWCNVAVVDPEGVLASFLAITTVALGQMVGHVLKNYKTKPKEVMVHWSVQCIVMCAIGWIIDAAGVKMNKQLWTPSYMFFTCGVCTGLLVFFYYFFDYSCQEFSEQDLKDKKWMSWPAVYKIRWFFTPFVDMGWNAMLIFVGGAQSVLDTIIAIIYVSSTGDEKTNLIDWAQEHIFQYQSRDTPQAGAVMAFVVTKCVAWMAIGVFLKKKNWQWKV